MFFRNFWMVMSAAVVITDRAAANEDINECSSSPCLNGGRCCEGDNMYTCTCKSGFTGLNCETDIDECASSPCVNAGKCVDGKNMYTCECNSGFSGLQCQNYSCMIKLRSYSYNNSPSSERYGYIYVNDTLVFNAAYQGEGTGYMRGIDTVVMSSSQCSVGDQMSFDTYVSSSSLISYLENLADGTVLIGVTCDDPYSNLAPAFPLLLSMGVDVRDVDFRGMFAFVLQKGNPEKTIFEKTTSRPEALELSVQRTGTDVEQIRFVKLP